MTIQTFCRVYFVLNALASAAVTSYVNNRVLEPIKTGEDVGVIIVSGAYMYYDQYEELGEIAIDDVIVNKILIKYTNSGRVLIWRPNGYFEHILSYFML